MSNVNLEEDHEALIVPKNLYKYAFISPTNKDNYSNQPIVNHNKMKENDITLSLLGTGQLHLNDFLSPKTFGINLKNEDLKHGRRDMKQIMKDTHSPNSLNSSNLSYKILNEILNAQQGDRGQTRSKLNAKSFEGKRTGPLNKTIECTADLLNSSKPFIEENEEVRIIQDKIKFFTSQLQTKMHLFENRKKVYTEENKDLQYLTCDYQSLIDFY
ncbi:MAG: hypothetical protein EOO43_19325 [Flavobacterium sp.]|nr:MAG: hypothetical protein EOO43_19325 [Flavobacterium sp.]